MRYHRVPFLVNATVLVNHWTWNTSNGDVLVAKPGDFRITDPDSGKQWSITASALRSGYTKIGHELYQSRGEVSAAQVSDSEGDITIHSHEGPETARPGDWVITDDSNNRWVVDDAWFRKRYRPFHDA